ncbi:hypothetical protein [Tateyamaria sp.]|uniref:hypothetical protein n=1 Tax=Tateyamaria sp. TaxID=1929288 RepID=UPI0032A07D65
MTIDIFSISIGVASIFLGLIALAVTVYFNMSKFSRTLSKLLEIQNGVLSVDQAKKITQFHLRDIKTVLEMKLQEFGSRVLPDALERKNLDGVKRELFNLAEASIGPSRNNISIFLLRGDVRMDFFMEEVNPIDGGIIQDVVNQMFNDIENAFEENDPDFDIILSKISLRVDQTIRAANARLNSRLDELYKK